MRVQAFKTLRFFFEKHSDCESQLRAWYKDAEHAEWKSPDEVKKFHVTASVIGDNRIVFNIKGNRYRLIVKFHYDRGWAFIRFIGTHAEYDKINAETI
ncbi:MAG TPA: type II toxin-antitoxin system HigB family toxin [Chitinophagales bacterium]|nr:type II toxin-antitoxin system HigB family toxin [Chitinophagales bacterium]